MQKESIKFTSSTIFEGMTSIRAIIKGIELGVNDRKIEKILFDKAKLPKIAKEIGYLRAISDKYCFEIVDEQADNLDKITLGTSHGGIVAICKERTLPYLDKDIKLPERGFFTLIEGIEDPYNFGYAMRSLYAMGCDGIILTERNWMSAAGVVARSSAGASEMFRIYRSSIEDAIDVIKNSGYSIVCADERTENILGCCRLSLPLLLVIGGEKRGISRTLLKKADTLVKIGYGKDFRASLSAASATAMFAYEIAKQNKL